MLYNSEDFHMMDLWFDLFGPFWWIVMVIVMLSYVITGVVIAYYVHKDAVKLRIQNPEIWLIIVFLFNVIGLLLYLLVRGNYGKRIGKDRFNESRI